MSARRKWCKKRRYSTRVDAVFALCNIYNRGQRFGSEKAERRAYECPRCKGWHLTSQPKRIAASVSGAGAEGNEQG